VSLLLILCLSLLAAPPAAGFDKKTHADISQPAFDQSSAATALLDLAIDSKKPLNAGYIAGSRRLSGKKRHSARKWCARRGALAV